MNEREARLRLACVTEPGDPATADAVVRRGAVAAWEDVLRKPSDALARRVAALDLDRVRADTESVGARFIIPGDAEWPESLEILGNIEPQAKRGGFPIGLWVRGPHALNSLRGPVGVVGSRTATAYGQRMAEDIAADLALAGRAIISGGAYGIDASAHRAALAVDGVTVAVLASGIDIDYPAEHEGVFARIAERGLVLTEYPPGQRPTRFRFLVRNRLIAALSECVVIVEAAARSGARNTATWARNCGREVAAVPGPATSAQSFGPHDLIRTSEAVLVTCAEHVVELAGPLVGDPVDDPRARDGEIDRWPADHVAVFETIPSRGVLDVSSIAVRCGLGVGTCLAALGELELGGFVRSTPRGWQLERRPVR